MGTPFIFSPSEIGGGGGKDSEVVVGEEAVLVLRETDLQVFECGELHAKLLSLCTTRMFFSYLEAVVEEPDEEWS